MAAAPRFMTVDLERYLANYDASTHVPRLLEILKHLPQKQHMEYWQYVGELLNTRLMRGRDIALYRDTINRLFSQGVSVELNNEWISQCESKNSEELELLQVALGQASTAGHKPQIRAALAALCVFYSSSGQQPSAMKCLTRMRDACTEEGQVAEMCELAVKVNIFRRNFALLSPYVARAEQLGEKLTDEQFVFFKVVSALIQLDKKNYKQCMALLMRVRRRRDRPAALEATRAFFAPGDLLLIGSLCSLATCSREEVSAFLAVPDFKIMLESEPTIRELLTSFHDCRYAAALAALEALLPRIELDFFLMTHAKTLVQAIRESAVKQYTSPYLSLDLKKMADAFQTDVATIQRELSQLIVRGEIHARIDKAAGVLRASVADERRDAFTRALQLGEEAANEMEMCLRQLSMQRNGVVVRGKQMGPLAKDPDRRRHH